MKKEDHCIQIVAEWARGLESRDAWRADATFGKGSGEKFEGEYYRAATAKKAIQGLMSKLVDMGCTAEFEVIVLPAKK